MERKKFYDPQSGISIKAYIAPKGWIPESQWNEETRKAAKMALLRLERDRRLMASDWMANPDLPVSEEETNLIFSYRQELRDLPQRPGAPWVDEEIPWPELPALHPAQMVVTTAPWLKEKTETHYTPSKENK